MKFNDDNFIDLIQSDELIHDYEFEMRIHKITKNKDIFEYNLKTLLIFTDYFEKTFSWILLNSGGIIFHYLPDNSEPSQSQKKLATYYLPLSALLHSKPNT